MAKKKIYVVTSGDYSDYRVDSVWATKEEADRYCQWRADRSERHEDFRYGWDVEEFPIRAGGDRPTPWYQALIERYGEEETEPYTVPIGLTWDDEAEYTNEPRGYYVARKNGFRAAAWGSSEEQAKKALYDRIAKEKAEREGL